MLCNVLQECVFTNDCYSLPQCLGVQVQGLSTLNNFLNTMDIVLCKVHNGLSILNLFSEYHAGTF